MIYRYIPDSADAKRNIETYVVSGNGPVYTCVLKTSIVSESGSEPVTPDEAKAHLFIDTADFDNLLDIYISAARQAVEKKYNTCLKTKNVKAVVYPGTTLPYTVDCDYTISTIKDSDDTTVTDEYKDLSGMGEYTVTYDVTENVTSALKIEVLKKIADLFENRGDDR